MLIASLIAKINTSYFFPPNLPSSSIPNNKKKMHRYHIFTRHYFLSPFQEILSIKATKKREKNVNSIPNNKKQIFPPFSHPKLLSKVHFKKS